LKNETVRIIHALLKMQ